MQAKNAMAAFAVAIVASLAGATPAAATGPPRDDKAVRAICATYAHSSYAGPSWVWRIDVPQDSNAGWGCILDGVFYLPSDVMDDPRTKRFENICRAAGGQFYIAGTGTPGPRWSYVHIGCSWL